MRQVTEIVLAMHNMTGATRRAGSVSSSGAHAITLSFIAEFVLLSVSLNYVVFCGLVSLMSSFHVYNNVVYFTSTYECWTPPWYLPPVFNNIMFSFFDQPKANLNVWLKTKLFWWVCNKKCGGITRWNILKHDIDSFKKCTSSKTTRYDNLLSKTEYLSRFFILVVNVWTFYCRWVITRPQIWCWLIEKL